MKLWPEPENEYERQWLRNWLMVFLPGFAVFGLGAATDLKPVVIAGALIVAVAGARAFRIMRRFRRCTGCGYVSYPRVGDDGSCFYCGVELPLNGRD